MTNIINSAIRLISEKRCSEQELKNYLEKKYRELPSLDNKIESACAYLNECGVLNDFRLAHHFASHYSHKGNNFITQFLLRRSLSKKIIQDVLNFIPNEMSRAWEEAKKKLLQLNHQSESNVKDVLTRFLIGRHFSFKAINSVLERIEGQSSNTRTSFNPLKGLRKTGSTS